MPSKSEQNKIPGWNDSSFSVGSSSSDDVILTDPPKVSTTGKKRKANADNGVESLKSTEKASKSQSESRKSPSAKESVASSSSAATAPVDSGPQHDVILPTSWSLGQPPAGECNLLIQIESEDAKHLDYEGVSGAIGRFEANDGGIILDLKGRQYQGSILPGPTAMLFGLAKNQHLRVEGITNEFSTIVQTSDVMAKLDAIVTGAQMEEGTIHFEDNVNQEKN